VAREAVWGATCRAGRVDGLPRVAVKGGRVRIGDALYPLIGTVSASHSIAEIGSEPRVGIGDVVTFFDDRDGSRPEDLAAACGSSVYDLAMHLNPLLPRRVLEPASPTLRAPPAPPPPARARPRRAPPGPGGRR